MTWERKKVSEAKAEIEWCIWKAKTSWPEIIIQATHIIKIPDNNEDCKKMMMPPTNCILMCTFQALTHISSHRPAISSHRPAVRAVALNKFERRAYGETSMPFFFNLC